LVPMQKRNAPHVGFSFNADIVVRFGAKVVVL
jgi:hypothetical protein